MALEKPEYSLEELGTHYRTDVMWLARYLIELKITPSLFLTSYKDPLDRGATGYVDIREWVSVDLNQFSEFISTAPWFTLGKMPLLTKFKRKNGEVITIKSEFKGFDSFKDLHISYRELQKLHKRIQKQLSRIPKQTNAAPGETRRSASATNEIGIIKAANKLITGMPISKKRKLQKKDGSLKLSEVARELSGKSGKHYLEEYGVSNISDKTISNVLTKNRSNLINQ